MTCITIQTEMFCNTASGVLEWLVQQIQSQSGQHEQVRQTDNVLRQVRVGLGISPYCVAHSVSCTSSVAL